MPRHGALSVGCLVVSLLFPAALGIRKREACDCNGRSRQCMFDVELLRRTGNGYRCLNCLGNTEGANCERCKEGFYRLRHQDHCVPCHCNPIGSIGAQCDGHGRCSCKPGVAGDKCNRCQQDFNSFSDAGCTSAGQIVGSACDCDPAGSTGQCVSGRCVCKTAVTGDRCDSCKPGYYNLAAENPEGCSQCFCYGHSTTCSSAENYSIHKIISTFQQGDEGWKAEGNGFPSQLQWSSHHKEVYVVTRRQDPVYFIAPVRFLGNQQLSYGQMLSFNYRVNRPGRHPSQHDVILEGGGLRISAPLMPNGKMLSCRASRTYTFRLDEQPSSNWRPRVSNIQFRQLLGNLTALRIRATYGDSTGYLSNVVLASAQLAPGSPALWVEQCLCPTGYQGQFCERCSPGYKRENSARPGALSNCVLCNCQGGGICDPDTGECYSGDQNSENIANACQFGFYSLPWNPQSCQPCPCQNGQGCSVLPRTQEIICNTCPPGTSGSRCELCIDGYFGDPLGERGPARSCQPCQCDSIDPNASGICNHLTGECKCKDGFFGNPLSSRCQACNCNSIAAEPSRCHSDGSCICKLGFEGPNCESTRCPACYGRVKTQVDQYLQQLQGLEMLIAQLQATEEPGSHVALEGQIRKVEEMLQQVLREAQNLQASDRSLGNRLSKMKSQEHTHQGQLDEIREIANRLQILRSQYQTQAQDTRRLVEKARLDLAQSKAKIEGVAIPSSDLPGGSNRFLILAQEAMNLANRHLYLANTIEQAARSAEEGSKQALALLRSFVSGEGISAGSLQGLRKKYNDVKFQTSELDVEASRASLDADRAYQDSQMVLSSLNSLPKFDENSFQEEVNQLRNKAASFKNLVEIYIEEHKRLQSNTGIWEGEIQELLQKGQNDRQISVQLLSRANFAKSKALQALSAGNATFDEVDGILKSLREFNLQVGDKQIEAEAAMRRLPFISNKVASANEKTKRAEAALGNAMAEVEAARTMAEEAKHMAGAIDQELERLPLEANRTADGVLELEKEIEFLRNKSRFLSSELKRKELGVDADTATTQETIQASQKAKSDAAGAGRVVQDVLHALENVLRMMEQPGSLDEQGVNMLEMNLSKAKTRNQQLKELMFQLEETAKHQKLRIKTLEKSITEILIDIKNLEEIRDNLPLKCYNVQPIERP